MNAKNFKEECGVYLFFSPMHVNKAPEKHLFIFLIMKMSVLGALLMPKCQVSVQVFRLKC